MIEVNQVVLVSGIRDCSESRDYRHDMHFLGNPGIGLSGEKGQKGEPVSIARYQPISLSHAFESSRVPPL